MSGSPRLVQLILVLAIVGGATKSYGSPFYDYTAIVTVGDQDDMGRTITSLSDNVSINDSGEVAFVGFVAEGSVVYVGDGASPPVSISSSTPSITTNYGRAVQINNAGQVVSRNSSTSSSSFIRRWAGEDQPGIYDAIADAEPGQTVLRQFEAVLSHPSINNNGQVVYSAFGGHGGALSLLCPNVGASDGCLATPQSLPPDRFNVNAIPLNFPLRPMIADDGQIVVRRGNLPTDPIVLFSYDLSTSKTIASSAQGFFELGRSPGIADDGSAIAFAGTRSSGNGTGIFLSVKDETGNYVQLPVAVAGERVGMQELGSDGADMLTGSGDAAPIYLADFDIDSRVSVAHINVNSLQLPLDDGLENDSFVLSFVARPNQASNPTYYYPGRKFSAELGVWTVQVDVVEVGGQMEFRYRKPIPVIQVGDTIPNLTPSFGNVLVFSLFDSLSVVGDLASPEMTLSNAATRSMQRGSHQLAFFVYDESGNAAIIRATKSNSCDTEIARLPQGKDNAPIWWNDSLDHSPFPTHNLARYGCVVSTMSRQLTSAYRLAKNGGVVDLPEITPKDLNEFLKTTSGPIVPPIPLDERMQGFNNNADLQRAQAVNLFNRYWLPIQGSLKWKSCTKPDCQACPESSTMCTQQQMSSQQEFIYDTICAKEAPVAVRVTLTKRFGHDVLVTGVANGEMLIADSSGGMAGGKEKLAQYGEYSVKGYVRDPDDLGFFTASTGSLAAPMLVDDIGRSTGFVDSIVTLEEIPNSVASSEAQEDQEDFGTLGETTHEVVVDSPVDGDYQLTVVGLGDGPYMLETSHADPAGEPTTANTQIQGYAVAGRTASYEIHLSGLSGSLVEQTDGPVPPVTGILESDADMRIQQSGMAKGTVESVSSSVPAGNVISQSPEAGTIVPVATEVNLVISTGAAQVEVPSVVGLAFTSAVAVLEGAELQVGMVSYKASDTVLAGSVIGQSPAGGTTISTSSTVSLSISTGPAIDFAPIMGATSGASIVPISLKKLLLKTLVSAEKAYRAGQFAETLSDLQRYDFRVTDASGQRIAKAKADELLGMCKALQLQIRDVSMGVSNITSVRPETGKLASDVKERQVGGRIQSNTR